MCLCVCLPIRLTCPSPPQLVKVDVVNKQHFEWSEDNVYPSEPIFVPSPYAKVMMKPDGPGGGAVGEAGDG